jgi:ketosteroid isomerase-like protein
MKHLFLVLLFPFFALAQSSDEIAIKALVQNSFDDIFSNYDHNKLTEYYTEDFLLLEHGEIWTIDTVKNYLQKASQRQDRPIRTNSFQFIKTKIKGKRAWVAYHNYATITKNYVVLTELHWLESAELIKTKTGWKMELLHSTRVPKEK